MPGKGESNSSPIMIREENKEEGQPANESFEQLTVRVSEEEVPITSSPLRDLAKGSVRELTFYTPPTTMSTPESSSRHYDRLVTKRSHPSTGTSSAVITRSSRIFSRCLRSRKLSTIAPLLQKGTFSRDLCSTGSPVKKLILGEIYQGVRKLETSHILNVPDNVVSKVASTVAAPKKMEVRLR